MLLSVDPGKRRQGCALWEDGELVEAWLTAEGESVLAGGRLIMIDALVIERPHIRGRAKTDRNDLIDVALSAGRVRGHLEMTFGEIDVVEFLPSQWKGSVPKEIFVERIKEALDDVEKSRVDLPRAKSLHHNVWDAVGIGLKYWRRL